MTTLVQGGSPQCTAALEIHHCPYPKGVLSFPRHEVTLMAEKVLVRVIKAVLGPHQDIAVLADADLVIDRGSDSYQALPEARGKPIVVTIILDPQRRLVGLTPGAPLPVSLRDQDGDGMADAWETAYNLTDPNADADQDGLTNYEEFRAGTNPRDEDDRLRLQIIESLPPPTPTGSSVVLAMEASEHAMRFQVQDSGPGIAPERIETLFQSPDSTRPGGWRFTVRLQGEDETVFFDL